MDQVISIGRDVMVIPDSFAQADVSDVAASAAGESQAAAAEPTDAGDTSGDETGTSTATETAGAHTG